MLYGLMLACNKTRYAQIDEWDVFMDATRRKRAFKLMLDAILQTSVQVVLVTPSDVDISDLDEATKKSYRRNQASVYTCVAPMQLSIDAFLQSHSRSNGEPPRKAKNVASSSSTTPTATKADLGTSSQMSTSNIVASNGQEVEKDISFLLHLCLRPGSG